MAPFPPCVPTCPPAELRWAIPAGVLNALWNDVLPRLVAKAWLGQAPTPTGELFDHLNDSNLPGTPIERLLADMGNFIPHPPPLPPPLPPPAYPLNPVAAKRFQMVTDHFSAVGGLQSIPVRFMGRGGYDFLLSDHGILVFVPKRPDPAHERSIEILRYYTFRRTGRKAIGLPKYLAAPHKATSTDSPTGPGQVVASPLAIIRAFLGDSVGDLSPEGYEQVVCAIRGLGVPWNPPNDGEGREALALLLTVRDPERLPSWLVEFRDTLFGEWSFPLDGITCLVKRFACWTIEGSVYRGMMTEFPRIVAEMWLEQERGVGGAKSYTSRMGGNGVRAREVFEERLETMLHDDSRMDLRAIGPGGVDPRTQGWTGPWDPEDVMITNKGLYFPEVPTMEDSLGATPVVRFETICKEIAAGRAGNPVFTDCMLAEGEN